MSGQKIIDGLQEAIAHAEGHPSLASLHVVRIPEQVDVMPEYNSAPDAAYENAVKLRDTLTKRIYELVAQLTAARSELHKVEEFIETWQYFREFTDVERQNYSTPSVNAYASSELSVSGRLRRNSKKETVAMVARDIIVANGAPMGRKALLSALLERGLTIEGRNPLLVMSTMLWRMRSVIIRLPRIGYWVSHLPYSREPTVESKAHDDSGSPA